MANILRNCNCTFIVGCGHSGNTLIQAILGSHSNIYAVPQEPRLGYRSIEEINILVKDFDQQTAFLGKRKWVEKTPINVLRVRELLHRFPKSKIIIMLRDGRDVAYSLMERYGSIKDKQDIRT